MGVKWKRHSKRVTSTRRWQALRLQALRRDGFRCVACGVSGRLEVDHIRPVRTDPALAWSLDNLQCLCASCHTRKTRIECGHDPLHEDRARWRDAVLSLANQPSPNGRNP